MLSGARAAMEPPWVWVWQLYTRAPCSALHPIFQHLNWCSMLPNLKLTHFPHAMPHDLTWHETSTKLRICLIGTPELLNSQAEQVQSTCASLLVPLHSKMRIPLGTQTANGWREPTRVVQGEGEHSTRQVSSDARLQHLFTLVISSPFLNTYSQDCGPVVHAEYPLLHAT